MTSMFDRTRSVMVWLLKLKLWPWLSLGDNIFPQHHYGVDVALDWFIQFEPGQVAKLHRKPAQYVAVLVHHHPKHLEVVGDEGVAKV